MILDYLNEFAKNQATTNNGYSDYTLDFQQSSPTTGLNSRNLNIVVTVNETVTGGFGFEVETADDSSFTRAQTVAKSTSVTGNVEAGTQLVVGMPLHHKRFLRLKWVGGCTGGKVSGHITASLQDNVPYQAHTGNA